MSAVASRRRRPRPHPGVTNLRCLRCSGVVIQEADGRVYCMACGHTMRWGDERETEDVKRMMRGEDDG